MTTKRKHELVKQIEAYDLKSKLRNLAQKDEEKRAFRHLPRQFSKGILIGNIAVVPRRTDDSRFVYVIADMVDAKILYDDINLKQTAILVAHYLADNKSMPAYILHDDIEFASKLFEIKNYNRFYKKAQKEHNEDIEFVYWNKLMETHRLADAIKSRIQENFDNTFRSNFAK